MGRTSDSRPRLLRAGHELIWGNSYGAVTIEALCDHAGVKKGSFYYFFDSKSDLMVAAINEWWVERRALADRLFSPEVPPLDRILAYLDFVVKRLVQIHADTGRVLGCPIFSLGAEIATQEECIRALAQHILNAGEDYFESALRDAQDAGLIDRTSSARAKARQLFALYEGTLTMARISNSTEPLLRLKEDVLDFLGASRSLAAA
jgi:TetR/AcrR family transcriptional repressor of nem operon